MEVPRFNIPRDRVIVLSSGAQDHLSLNEVISGLFRHINGEWGQVNDSDRMMNDYNLSRRGTLMSAYVSDDGTRYWVLTEAGHERTVVLLPAEYGTDNADERKGYILHGRGRRTDPV